LAHPDRARRGNRRRHGFRTWPPGAALHFLFGGPGKSPETGKSHPSGWQSHSTSGQSADTSGGESRGTMARRALRCCWVQGAHTSRPKPSHAPVCRTCWQNPLPCCTSDRCTDRPYRLPGFEELQQPSPFPAFLPSAVTPPSEVVEHRPRSLGDRMDALFRDHRGPSSAGDVCVLPRKTTAMRLALSIAPRRPGRAAGATHRPRGAHNRAVAKYSAVTARTAVSSTARS
jgi:hypothetical protein